MIVREVRRRERDRYIELIAAQASDEDRSLHLLDSSVREIRGAFGWVPFALLRLFAILHRSPVHLLVAEEGGKLVGTTVAIFRPPGTYVAAVGVDPGYRRRGIATQLLARAELLSRERRIPFLVLDVYSSNSTARRLYAREGWTEGPHVRWWRLAGPVSSGSPEPPGPSWAVPHITPFPELAGIRSHLADSLPFDFPPSCLHPSEVVAAGPRWIREDLAVGPGGTPIAATRIIQNRGNPIRFLFPAAREAPPPGVLARLVREAHGFGRSGNPGESLVLVLSSQSFWEKELESLGAVLVTESETWWKRVARPGNRGDQGPPAGSTSGEAHPR